MTELFNADAFSLNRAATSFVAEANGADLALFYFAGHGVQLFDRNFLLARDADPKSVSRPRDLGLDLSSFMGALRNSGAVRLALLIDACRDNPLSFEETVRVLDRLRTDPPSSPHRLPPAEVRAAWHGSISAPADRREEYRADAPVLRRPARRGFIRRGWAKLVLRRGSQGAARKAGPGLHRDPARR